MRNTDNDERTFFRTSERIICMNGEWYFSTRGGQEGPYPNKAIAEREVLAALRELPHAYRETLVLRLVEGMTGPEIAEKTGLQPGSVRVNLHRGMKLLRRRLGVETER